MRAAKTDLSDLDKLAVYVGEKLDVPGNDLRTVVRRAGRALPRRLRRDAAYLVDAQTMAYHPRLRGLVDYDRVAHARARLRDHLKDRDPDKERTDRTLGQIAAFVLNMLIFAALLVTVLTWRGVLGPPH